MLNLAGFPFHLDVMRLRDVPAVVALERTVFPSPWPARAFIQEISQNPLSRYYVLKGAGFAGVDRLPGLLGYVGYWLVVDQAHVGTLAVHPEWRGRGLGELLFSTVVGEAREAGAATITLEVRESNRPARTLYTKYGLQVVGRRRRYYPDNGEDALIMTAAGLSAKDYGQLLEQLATSLEGRLREEFGEKD
ncbi:MAG: ribosomal protein S18-alanine N-acetyltransferase [Anaerolineae bacterium]